MPFDATPLDVSTTLLEAAELIRKRGWFSASPDWHPAGPLDLMSVRSPVCAMLAISAVANGDITLRQGAAKRLLAHLGTEVPPRNYDCTVMEWNDKQPSGDVVIAALEKAALAK